MSSIDFSKIQSAINQFENKGRKLLEIKGSSPFTLFEGDLSKATQEEVAKLKKAADSTEAYFAKNLLKEMLPKGFGGEGPMGDFTSEQFMNAISEQIGKSGSLGIAKMLSSKLSESIYRQEAGRLILSRQNHQEQTKP